MDLIYIKQVKLSALEIETRLEDDAKVFGLILKKHFPFSKNLPDAGFAINNYACVFELCHAGVAAYLLNQDVSLSILMPCRISIYEKDDVTFLSTPNLESQLDFLQCEDGLKEEILSLYRNIIKMIENY